MHSFMKLFKFEKFMIHAVLITACFFFFLWICRTIFVWFVNPVTSSLHDKFDPPHEAFEEFSESSYYDNE